MKEINAGLKAAAKSMLSTPTRFHVEGRGITCPICGHDEFEKREMLINTTGMTFFKLDWLNHSACALVCKKCSRIELFVKEPESR